MGMPQNQNISSRAQVRHKGRFFLGYKITSNLKIIKLMLLVGNYFVTKYSEKTHTSILRALQAIFEA